jgi:hypothetical protein
VAAFLRQGFEEELQPFPGRMGHSLTPVSLATRWMGYNRVWGGSD